MARKIAPGKYQCPECEETKGWNDFYHPPTKRNRISHYCKDCHRDKQRENRRRGNDALRAA